MLRLLLLLAFLIFDLACESCEAQDDVGIGTFSDLVNQSFSRSAPPEQQTTALIAGGQGGAPQIGAPTVESLLFFSQPQTQTLIPGGATVVAPNASNNEAVFTPLLVSAEYDYRFNQIRNGGVGTNINEAHATMSFASVWDTNFAFQYFHTWSDGSNSSTSATGDGNGGTFTFTKNFVPNEFALVIPFSFSETDNSSTIKDTTKDSYTDKYAVNPFLRFSTPPLLNNHLILSVAPGYRLTSNNQAYTNVALPDGSGSNGVFNLLGEADYQLFSIVLLKGSITWNRYTNYETTPPVAQPYGSSIALGAGFTVQPCPNVKVDVAYQYDGFNSNFYQHSLTVAGTYKF